jgi:hypothetical protein
VSKTHDEDYQSKVNILSLLRLSVGMSEGIETHPPDDEEKELVEKIITLRNLLMKTLDEDRSQMIVAMAAVTQLLEDILCHYGEDMPDVLTAIFAKLAQHGTRHMDLKDNPPREIKFTGTVH